MLAHAGEGTEQRQPHKTAAALSLYLLAQEGVPGQVAVRKVELQLRPQAVRTSDGQTVRCANWSLSHPMRSAAGLPRRNSLSGYRITAAPRPVRVRRSEAPNPAAYPVEQVSAPSP